LRYYNGLVTLARSAVSSVVEPVVAGIQTGNLKDSFGAMKDSFKFLFSNSKDRAELEQHLGMISGIINEMSARDLLSARADFGTFGNSKAHRLSSRYMDIIGQTKLTYVQRMAAAVNAETFLQKISSDMKAGKDAKYTTEVLREYGVPDADIPAFIDYVLNMKSEGREIDNKKMNDLYALANLRHVEGVIQANYKGARQCLLTTLLDRCSICCNHTSTILHKTNYSALHAWQNVV